MLEIVLETLDVHGSWAHEDEDRWVPSLSEPRSAKLLSLLHLGRRLHVCTQTELEGILRVMQQPEMG